MNNSRQLTNADRDLIDDYFFGELNESEIKELELRLEQDNELKQAFVQYAQFASELQMSAKSSRAHLKVLSQINEAGLDAKNIERSRAEPTEQTERIEVGKSARPYSWVIYSAISISLTLGLLIGVFGFHSNRGESTSPVAWLVNAHNCVWVKDFEPTASLVMGDRLKLESGVAQLRFSCGANLILEGPAELTLLTDTSAELKRGKLAVKVPKGFRGFEIFSPQGRILDLGTEFGVSVTEAGQTDVVVFEGEVQTFLGKQETGSLRLLVNQSASILENSITRNAKSVDTFVRDVAEMVKTAEVVKPTPRTTDILFDGSASSGIKDVAGVPVGFNCRLEGTGGNLPGRDQNLEVDLRTKSLKLTTTRSDINHQVQLPEGEYLGFRLSEFGFTGEEDFSVAAVVPNIPNLEDFGQFGLYVGVKSDQVIRGGIIKFGMTESGANTIFLVNNHGGADTDTNKVGLLNQGTDLRLVLSRRSGDYSLMIENISDGGSTTLSIKHPVYLDSKKDLQVGIFGANPYNDNRKTVYIAKFSVTIWK